MIKIQTIITGSIMLAWLSTPIAFAGNGKTNFSVSPFTPIIVKNKGQFDKYDVDYQSSGFQSPYAGCQSGNTIILIKSNSLQFVENIKRKNEGDVHEMEKMKSPDTEFEMYRQTITFLNANPLAEFEEGKSVEDYFTYPDPLIKNKTIIANGFRQVIIKNIYEGIDIEYSIQDDGGIKYSFIISPDKDASIIKMEWDGVDKIILDKSGNLQIHSQNGTYIDKAPHAFYKSQENSSIAIKFSVVGNIVSFLLPDHSPGKTLIIDPWITNPNFSALYNRAYDIQHDPSGYVYVYGGTNPYQLKKFTPLGSPVWTFNTNATGWYGDFTLDATGNAYCLYGAWGGECVKISPGGLQVWSYYYSGCCPLYETYRICPNPANGQLTIMGMKADSINYDLWPMAVDLDPVTGNYSPMYMHPTCNGGEARCLSVDANGDAYGLVCYAGASINYAADNLIWKINSSNATINSVVDGYILGEADMTNTDTYYSGFNGTALSTNNLFTYDGETVKKWDKATLSLIDSVSIAGGVHYTTGGLCTDSCGNLFVGGPTSILEFDNTLTLINSVPTTGQVYDVNTGNVPGEILACGNGFLGSFSFPVCSGNLPVAIFTAPSHICPGTCTNFTNLSMNGISFEWHFPGGIPGVSTVPNPVNICYSTPGNYDVELIATNAAGGDTLLLSNYITVYPSPPPQSITQSGDTLFALTGAANYQWYFNASIINGATNYFYVAPASGDYNVVATDMNGCEVEAAIFNVVASVQEIGDQEILIFPNPVEAKVKIHKSKVTRTAIEFSVYNAIGEKMEIDIAAVDNSNPDIELDVHSLAAGLYYIEIRTSEKTFRSKFVKSAFQ